MGYISTRKARLQAQLVKVQAQLSALYDSMAENAAQNKSYKFDSGEGSQSITRRDLKEILDAIARLEATESHIINELNNMGLVNINVRRKNYSGVFR